MTSENSLLFAGCAIVGFIVVWVSMDSPKKQKADKTKQAKDDQPEPPFQRDDQSFRASPPTWCDILLVEPDAGLGEIRKAFARVMKSIHPDTSTHDAATTARCLKVKKAYEAARLDAQRNGSP